MSLLSLTKKLTRTAQPQQPSEADAQPADTPAPAAAAGAARELHPIASHLEPILSEKSVALQEQGVATFRVPHTATKHQVALAVFQRYGVRVRQVRLIRMLPKMRRRGKTAGFTTAWKKAYVQVDDVQKVVSGP